MQGPPIYKLFLRDSCHVRILHWSHWGSCRHRALLSWNKLYDLGLSLFGGVIFLCFTTSHFFLIYWTFQIVGLGFFWLLCLLETHVLFWVNMNNFWNCFLNSLGFVIYIEFRRWSKGLFFIPYANILTDVVFDKMGLKKSARQKTKFCLQWRCWLSYHIQHF